MGRKYYRRLNDDTWFEYDMWESGIVNPGPPLRAPLWFKLFLLILGGPAVVVTIYTIIKVLFFKS